MTKQIIISAVLVFCGLLTACAGMTPTSKTRSLPDSVRMFNDALRWNRYQAAGGFVVPMDRASFVRKQQDIGESRRVMEYKTVEITRSDEQTARVVVQWKYTVLQSPVVQKERTAQIWTQVGRDWFLLRMEPEEKPEEDEDGDKAQGGVR